jgi:hypothetical protein
MVNQKIVEVIEHAFVETIITVKTLMYDVAHEEALFGSRAARTEVAIARAMTASCTASWRRRWRLLVIFDGCMHALNPPLGRKGF